MVYLVLVSKKGGYVVHSSHATESKAQTWAECLRHSGEDCAVATISKDDASDLWALAEQDK